MIDLDDENRPEHVNKVIEIIKKKNIKYVRLQFIDINGITKSFSVSTRDIENIMEQGQNFDGSSVTGMGSIEESDMTAIPDPSTFAVIPWREEEISSCRMICDIYTPDGKKYDADPRNVLKKMVDKAKQMGYIYKCAPELEFFILTEEETELRAPQPLDMKGYFDLHPGDITESLRREMCDIAEQFGITIEVAHHEVALGQNEIDFKYDEAITTADRTVTMKNIIKGVAARNGYLATFMPKPFFGVNGSGMHVHQSLWTVDGENAFYDENSEEKLSEIAFQFIGGQLKYGREMCAILASWPNSFKRLVPGYEAPVYIAWGHRNRSPLIRVPDFGGRKKAARIEIRCPDPAGNPYLQFAVLLGTGLDGITKKITPPDPTELNVYKLSFEERTKMNIISLPESLSEALNEFAKSKLMKEIFGEKLFNNFLHVKRSEWDEYRTQISDWEFERYIEKL